MNKLYVVATPIGNIDEINKRAIEALKASHIIYCEDTRVTKKLFNLINIDIGSKKFISLTGFNEKQIVDKIDLKNNIVASLVSDAGYPMISDPGYNLINFAINNKIDFEIINGPCALIHALVASGFSSNSFYFAGFLDDKKTKLINQLFELKKINSTLIIYESVHRIINTLKSIEEVFGNNINVIVAKELTKMNETFYRGKINSIIDQIDVRGEFVILIDNNSCRVENIEIQDYLNEVKQLIAKNNPEKIACKMVAYKYNLKSKDLFNALQVKKNII